MHNGSVETVADDPPTKVLKDDDDDDANDLPADFKYSEGLTTSEAAQLLKVHGRNELPEKKVPKWLVFLQQLYGPMPILIWVAIVITGAIQSFPDMGILLGIQFANATIAWYESTKAADAISALKASLKPLATVKRDGKWINMDATLVVPGDMVLLASGSAIPADCRVNKGQIDVDQSAMTGESLPVTFHQGDACKMGSTVTRGEVEATVQYTGVYTFLGKTATLIQGVQQGLGNIQKILIRIMVVLVVVSFVLCFTALMYLLFKLHVEFKEALQFTVVLLIASIPMAIEIVTTTTLALGSKQLSKHGCIVTKLSSIEELAGMDMLCSDKTGTLTLNKMVIQDDCPTFVHGEDRKSVLRLAAMAAKWREPPRDALDTMVLTTADLASLEEYHQVDYMPFDPTVKRTEGTVRAPDGRVFKITKGAPQIIMKLIQVDQEAVQVKMDAKVTELGTRGIRSLAIARTNVDGLWEMVGLLTFLDPPRPDTKRTIDTAVEYGVDVKMITGDHMLIAKETARVLGMGTNIQNAKGLPSMGADGKMPEGLGRIYGEAVIAADGFAEVFPEHKFLIVEILRQRGFRTGMTGDGVNDAPALKRADVGIAVHGATDAARAAADIVLTSPGLSVIVDAMEIARCVFMRVRNFINYRIACTFQLLMFFFIAVIAFHPKEYHPSYNVDFFSLPVLMLMLITLLNDGTLITIGYDYVIPSKVPEKWNLKALFVISIVIATVAGSSSLLLLWMALDSHNTNGIFHRVGLPPMIYSQIITMMYLKVSLSDFMTLFNARTPFMPFFMLKPGRPLAIGACIAVSTSTLLASFWPKSTVDHIHVLGLARGEYKLWPLWVWIYCIVWWFIEDAAKVAAYTVMYKFNLFGMRTHRIHASNGRPTQLGEVVVHAKKQVSSSAPDSSALASPDNTSIVMRLGTETNKGNDVRLKVVHLGSGNGTTSLIQVQKA